MLVRERDLFWEAKVKVERGSDTQLLSMVNGQDRQEILLSLLLVFFLRNQTKSCCFQYVFMPGCCLFESKLGITLATALFPHSHLHYQHGTVKN